MLEHFVHQDLALDFVHSYSGSQATCHARRREIDSISFDSTDWPGSDGQNFPVGLSGSRVAALARPTPELVRARRGGRYPLSATDLEVASFRQKRKVRRRRRRALLRA